MRDTNYYYFLPYKALKLCICPRISSFFFVCVQVLLQKLRAHPFPLYIAVLTKDAATWRSGYNVSEADLADTADAAFSALIYSLELHLGTVFVSHTLAYITVAHEGLSEVCFKTFLNKSRCFLSVLSLSLSVPHLLS